MDQAIKEYPDKPAQGTERIPKFLKILFQILDNKTYKEYISWSDDGKVVIVNKPEEFADNLLPVYFKHNNYSSFVRQLNLYSFRKKKQYPYENAFFHAMFLKGRQKRSFSRLLLKFIRDLLKFVKRKSNNASSEDQSCLKFEAGTSNQSEYDQVNGENLTLKRIHEETAEKIEGLERTLKILASENETLQQQCKRKKQNEHFLKRVVNHVAKIHGCHQIEELIDSIAFEGLGSKFTATPEVEKSPERKECYPQNYHAERTRSSTYNGAYQANYQEQKGKAFPDQSELQATCQRTVSSVSTLPELTDPLDFYHSFDQIIDQKLRHQSTCSDFGFNPSFGFEDL